MNKINILENLEELEYKYKNDLNSLKQLCLNQDII